MSENRCDPFPDKLVLYRGHARLVCDRFGRIASGVQGLYVYNTRFLSCLELAIGGKEPRFVSAHAVDRHSMVVYLLAASPAGARAGPVPSQSRDGGEIAYRAIAVQVDRFLEGGLRQDIHVANHGLVATSVELRLRFAADFADQLEVRRGGRQQNAPIEARWSFEDAASTLRLDYLHPQLRHGLVLRITGAGRRQPEGTDHLKLDLDLNPQERQTVAIEVRPIFGGTPFKVPREAFGMVAQKHHATDRAVTLSTPIDLVQNAWSRAVSDLDALALGEGEGSEARVPAAGIPSYQGLFGRDTLITGLQAMLLSPDFLRGALRLMAHWQGWSDDPERDEQPGKLLHQHQLSPLALLGANPFYAYYGDYTAPASFLIGVALDLAATGDLDFTRRMLTHVEAALGWMERDGDADGDGFYEYETRASQGLKNQGWKDSGQALLYPDGRMVANPIALATIQARYYAAKQLTGLVLIQLDDKERGEKLCSEATELKRRFNEAFWLEKENYLALALDPDKSPWRPSPPMPASASPSGSSTLIRPARLRRG